jgi:hypothetical protein
MKLSVRLLVCEILKKYQKYTKSEFLKNKKSKKSAIETMSTIGVSTTTLGSTRDFNAATCFKDITH